MGRSGYVTRIIIVAVFICTFFLCMMGRLFYVQVHEHNKLYSLARKKYTAIKKNKGIRGEIFDIDGNLLVGNVPCVDIRADPQLTGDKQKTRELAGFFYRKLGLNPDKIFRRLSQKKRGKRSIRQVVIKNAVPLDLAQSLKREVLERKFKGIFFFDSVKRYYPKNELLSNIIGFVNVDRLKVIPVSGLEKCYNSILSPGKSKLSVYERSRKGIPLSYGKSRLSEANKGGDLYLTINEPIQNIVEEELDKLVAKWKPRAAYAVMVDPKTGSIMAMAQRPTFNPNNRKSITPESWRDRIVTDGFEPGSSMKPLVIAGALDIGVIKPWTKFFCENGAWLYGGKILHDTHPYADMSVAQIIQKSSNIGTAKISLSLPKRYLYWLLRAYGFGQETGIPFKPEATGILRDLSKWDKLSPTRFPIGQGVLVTPLQLVSAYSVLANGGTRMRLRIVDRIMDPETKAVYKVPVKKLNTVLKHRKAAREVVQMMKLVTERGGTATRAAIPGYDVAGKTGTTQKWVDGAYSHSKYFATFIGFVPADDPAFVLLVTADEPKGSIYGGVVSAPAFKDIALKTLRYLDIAPNRKI